MLGVSSLSCAFFVYITTQVARHNESVLSDPTSLWSEFAFGVVYVLDFVLHLSIAPNATSFLLQPANSVYLSSIPGLLAPFVGRYMYLFGGLRALRISVAFTRLLEAGRLARGVGGGDQRRRVG